jgi:hypothetical protein
VRLGAGVGALEVVNVAPDELHVLQAVLRALRPAEGKHCRAGVNPGHMHLHSENIMWRPHTRMQAQWQTCTIEYLGHRWCSKDGEHVNKTCLFLLPRTKLLDKLQILT